MRHESNVYSLTSQVWRLATDMWHLINQTLVQTTLSTGGLE